MAQNQLVVTHANVSFDGTESWGRGYANVNPSYYLTFSQNNNAVNNSGSFSHFEFGDIIRESGLGAKIYLSGSTTRISCRYTGQPETLAGFKDLLKSWYQDGTPLQAIYPLANPITYQLTPQQTYSVCIQVGYPYLNYLNLITDRTQNDVNELIGLLKTGVNPSDHKGAYNASDLNRLGEAINYIKEKSLDIGIEMTDRSGYYKIIYELPEGTINLHCSQPGDGEPSPDNIRPIFPSLEIDGIGRIYGGTLDTQTAMLTITHFSKFFNGSERWYPSTYEYPYNAFYVITKNDSDFPDGKKSGGDILFSHVPHKMVRRRETESGGELVGGIYLWCRLEGIYTQGDFGYKLMSFADVGTPFQIVYEMEEPITVELSKKQLEQVAKQIGNKRAIINTMQSTWDYPDIPCDWQLNEYVHELEYIRQRIAEYRANIELPETMRHLDFEEANQMERLLVVVDEVIDNIKKSYRGYSGRLLAGGGFLP